MKKFKVLQPIYLYAVMIQIVMPVVFSTMSTYFGKTTGYFGSYGIYLLLLLLVLIPYALLNGSLEELFWRYTFSVKLGDDCMCAYIIPTIIFTCWHFA